MSHFSAAVVKGADGWSASELSLADAADVEDVADRLRDVDPHASLSLLFVESDDAYLVILRLDHGLDLRVFGSDATFVQESRLGSLLLGDIEEPVIDLDLPELTASTSEPDDVTVPPIPELEPVGDVDVLSDLGVPAHRLLELCTREGMLPSDITAEVCQEIGCGDEVEELREV